MSEVPATAGGPGGQAPEVDPRIGATLDGRYQLLKKLGAGGFGAVYEAEHVLIKRKVAVKVLHAHVATDMDMIARFKREAIAATATGHPHIVEVMDLGRTPDGGAYMVLELLSGRDWGDRLEREGPQPIGRTVKIVRQVLDGLQAAHDKGIVHRDLKAENVFLVTKDGDPDFVKIVDFGISKMREEGQPADAGVTHTGMALGTPAAMAPEQFQGKKDVDHRADLWAVGVMLYRALAGRWPFDGETYAMLAVDVMTGKPPSLHELRPDVPPELSAIVDRLLAKDREGRHQSAREVRAALLPFESHAAPAPARDTIDVHGATQASPAVAAVAVPTPRASEAAPSPNASPPAPRRAVVPVAAAIAAAGALVVGVWLYANRDGSVGSADLPPVELTPDAGPSIADPSDAPVAAGAGRLLLLTTPSGCLVSESGEPLGISPLDTELPAGAHRLAIECPEQALTGEAMVAIEPGHTARSVVTLERDAGRPRVGRHDREGHEETEPTAGTTGATGTSGTTGTTGATGTSGTTGTTGATGTSATGTAGSTGTTDTPASPDPGPTSEPTRRPDAGRGFTRPGILGGGRTH